MMRLCSTCLLRRLSAPMPEVPHSLSSAVETWMCDTMQQVNQYNFIWKNVMLDLYNIHMPEVNRVHSGSISCHLSFTVSLYILILASTGTVHVTAAHTWCLTQLCWVSAFDGKKREHTYQRVQAIRGFTHFFWRCDQFPILCEENLNRSLADVALKIHPTAHYISICAHWSNLATIAAVMENISIIGMVATTLWTQPGLEGQWVTSFSHSYSDSSIDTTVQDFNLCKKGVKWREKKEYLILLGIYAAIPRSPCGPACSS